MSYTAAILRDDKPENSKKWEIACEKENVTYQTVNMLRADSLKVIQNLDPDFCLCRPPDDLTVNKNIFDRKLFLIESELNIPCYPGYHEISIYENKASLAWFLEVNKIPHPATFVSADKEEAVAFTIVSNYPLFAKTLIGAAGSGIKKIKNLKEAQEYVEKAFSEGVKRRYGPNRTTGSPSGWIKKAVRSPSYFVKKLKLYNRKRGEVQKNIVLFQEYVEHTFEWRIVKIGESWFGYKKLKAGEMASGAKQFEYGDVPVELLEFSRKLCEEHHFNFMAVDLFYNEGKILVNELQTIFGHKNEAICFVNGRPGRYRFKNEEWLFEEGMFNTNESYHLRLKAALQLYKRHLE